jgi:hypothetical protein
MLQLSKNSSPIPVILMLLISLSCEQTSSLEQIKKDKSSVFENDQQGIITEKQEVQVLEHIAGKRYSYVKVKSGSTTYWLATMLGNFEKGQKYFYTEGIEKTQYLSTELNRTFDRIILVTQLFSSSNQQIQLIQNHEPVQLKSGSIPIKSLVAKSTELNGKEVQLTARIVKVNAAILDRNWYHIQDGTLNGYDLVFTSTEEFPVGHVVTIRGILANNKDFGAGYKYEMIVENARSIR